MTLVMVVDDDQDLAEMLGIVLTGAGIDVDLVSRGDEVMDVFRNNPPDLVLTKWKIIQLPVQRKTNTSIRTSNNTHPYN